MVKLNNERTSPKVAANASKILRDPTSSAMAKSLAASALTQAPHKSRGWTVKKGSSDALKLRNNVKSRKMC